MDRKKTSALPFTLIELIMVVVIIGVLLLVAILTFYNFQFEEDPLKTGGILGTLRAMVFICYPRSLTSGMLSWF